MTSMFGTFTSRHEVEQQVLSTLQTWLLTYLAEVERQEGLAPRTITQPGGNPPPNSLASYPSDSPFFRGGLDFETYRGDLAPLLIAVVQPTGTPERRDAGRYGQWYEVQVGAIIEAQDEPSALALADQYGKAVMGLLSQQGGLGTRVDDSGTTVPFAVKTLLTGAPRTEFLPPADDRRFARSVTVCNTFVETIADESQGPRTPPPDPYVAPQPWPTTTEVQIQLQSQNPLSATSPVTGVAVTTQVGQGQVVIEE